MAIMLKKSRNSARCKGWLTPVGCQPKDIFCFATENMNWIVKFIAFHRFCK